MFSSRKRAENSNTNIESGSSSNRKKDATTVNNNTNAIEWGGETRDLLCRDGLRRDDRLVVEASVSNEGTFSGGLSKMMGGGASGKEKDKSCTQRVIGYGTCGLCCDRLEEEEGNGGGFGDGGFDDDDDNFPSGSKTSVTLIVPLRIGLSNTKNASRKCQAVVRVLFDVVPAMKKRIYLFRHGESAWNEAQRNVNVRNMMAYDHPLTEAGVAQCVRTAVLAKKPPTPTISSSASSGNDDWEEVYANTYHVIVSPLTRAVQTAMILLAKHPATMKRNADVQKRNAAVKMASSLKSSFATATTHSDLPPLIDIEGMNISGSPSVKTQSRREREEEDAQMWPKVDFRFSRACREIKSVGGLDSVGIECGGTRIFKRASEKLNLLNLAETQTIVDIFSERKCAEYFDVDSRDVRDKWWTAGDESDTSSSLVNERTKEFWEELKNSSHSSVSVVSHSDFIRKLLRQTTDDACNTRSAKETLKKVREHKICNAGCIGLDVMFNPRTGNIEVLECELLFGTTFQD
jgi:broad specificity phosphatase PhoE